MRHDRALCAMRACVAQGHCMSGRRRCRAARMARLMILLGCVISLCAPRGTLWRRLVVGGAARCAGLTFRPFRPSRPYNPLTVQVFFISNPIRSHWGGIYKIISFYSNVQLVLLGIPEATWKSMSYTETTQKVRTQKRLVRTRWQFSVISVTWCNLVQPLDPTSCASDAPVLRVERTSNARSHARSPVQSQLDRWLNTLTSRSTSGHVHSSLLGICL